MLTCGAVCVVPLFGIASWILLHRLYSAAKEVSDPVDRRRAAANEKGFAQRYSAYPRRVRNNK